MAERQRIEKEGGKVRQSVNELGQSVGCAACACVRACACALVTWSRRRPFRVFQKGKNGPGLAVSRSFGDEAAHVVGGERPSTFLSHAGRPPRQAGVTSVPDVLSTGITRADQFLVLARSARSSPTPGPAFPRVGTLGRPACAHAQRSVRRSDGVWDMLTMEEVAAIIDKAQGQDTAAVSVVMQCAEK